MANRLTTTPKLWFLECKYCQTTPTKDLHEQELMTKARKLCRNHETNHFLAFLGAEFLRLDHSVLHPQGQIEILTEVHSKTGCDCLTALTDQIADDLTTPTPPNTPTTEPKTYKYIRLPDAKSSKTTKKVPTRTAPTKPTSLLDRLKNGQHTR